MKIIFSLILCTAFISGCADKMVLENPEADYWKCLEEHEGDQSQCEAERAAYGQEAEEALTDSPLDDSTQNYDPGDFGPGEDPRE